MRRTALGLLALLALPLEAAVGPERRLSDSAVSVSDAASAAFDGSTYGVVWSRTNALDTTIVSYARVSESGQIAATPTVLATTFKPARPAIAATPVATLVAWVDRPADSPVKYMGAWFNAAGEMVDTPFEIFSASTKANAAIDVTTAENSFIVVLSGDNLLDTAVYEPFAKTATRRIFVSDDFVADGRAAFHDGVLLVAWDQYFVEPCAAPLGCPGTRPRARLYDFQLGNSLTLELVLTGNDVTSAVATDSGFVVATGGPTAGEFRMTPISRRGTFGVTHIEPYRYGASLTRIGPRLFGGFHRGQHPASSNVYFTVFDTELRPELAPGQAYTISNTLRNEDALTLATGSSTLIAVYATTDAENVNRQNAQTFFAYRIIDPTSLPQLPAAPAAPVLVAGAPQGAPASLRIGWAQRPGTKYYRLEIVSEDGLDRRDVTVNGNVTDTLVNVPRNGIYQFRLIVEDENGISSASDVLRVEVPTQATPPPPKPRRRAVKR